MMRDTINEKNVDFQKSYRQQKENITAQVIRLVCIVYKHILFYFHNVCLLFLLFYYLSSKKKRSIFLLQQATGHLKRCLLKISKENVSGFVFKSFIYRILNNWFLGYHKAKKRNLSLGIVVNGTVPGYRTERNEDQNNYLEPEGLNENEVLEPEDLNENEVLEPEDLNENEVLEPKDLNNNEVLLELANDEELKKSERRSLKKREKGAISLSFLKRIYH